MTMKRFTRQPWKASTFLYIFLLGVVVLPIVLVSITILQVYKQDLLEQTTDRMLQTLRAVTYSEEQEIGKAETFSAAIGMDQEVLGRVTLMNQTTPLDRQNYVQELRKALDQYGTSMSGSVQAIHFFFKNGGSYSYLKDAREDSDALRNSDWYRNARMQQDRVLFAGLQKGVLAGSDDDSIVTAISPSYLQSLHDVDLILFVFSRSAFEAVLRQHPYSETSSFLIATRGGEIVASSTASLPEEMDSEVKSRLFAVKEGAFIHRVNGEKMLITFATVDTAGWKVIHQVPYSELTAKYDGMFRLVLYATLLVIAVFLLISFFVAYKFTKPIHMLVVKMSRVMQGNLNAKIETTGSREMVILGGTFNHMMDQIKSLIRDKEQEETAKRKAEMAALQSQINPHFLINTLNSIRLMAVISKAENIRRMTHALMRLLSSSFNRGGSLTELAEEIENLRQYLFIMEARYGNKLEVDWDVEPETKDKYILKLLLQPILENCIVHGLTGKESDGKLKIAIGQGDGGLCITISDNGAGMSDEQIAHFHEAGQYPSSAFSGMGLTNVHQRIQLHYGDPYGVSITRNEEGGTTFFIRVPLLDHGDEEERAV